MITELFLLIIIILLVVVIFKLNEVIFQLKLNFDNLIRESMRSDDESIRFLKSIAESVYNKNEHD